MQAADVTLKEVVRKNSLDVSLIDSILLDISYYYDSSPWKYVPGPWLMKLSTDRNPDRFVAILGCSDKNQRGLAIYESVANYMARPPLPLALSLLFQEGKKKYPVLLKTNGVSLETLNRSDIYFLETGLRCVADFILEAARLSGGGPQPSAEGRKRPDEVLELLKYDDSKSYYPCKQVKMTSQGEVNVAMGLIVTMTTISHSVTDGAICNDARGEVRELSSNHKTCIVCHKTESDCRSKSGKGLLRCSACNSDTAKYCSKECQRVDWKRHKTVCAREKLEKVTSLA